MKLWAQVVVCYLEEELLAAKGVTSFFVEGAEFNEIVTVDSVLGQEIWREGPKVEDEALHLHLSSESWLGFIDWRQVDSSALVPPPSTEPAFHISSLDLHSNLILTELHEPDAVSNALALTSSVEALVLALEEMCHVN